MLTQSIELIAQGRSGNTRVWAGPLTRMFVPEVRESWCTVHIQKPSENNTTYLFLAALGEGAGRGGDREILICSWSQSATKHKSYTELHCLFGWGCSTCAHVDLPCMTGWAQTWGPSKLFYPHTCCSAVPGSQNNPPGGVMPSGKKTSQICFPTRDIEGVMLNRDWDTSKLSSDIRQPLSTGIAQRKAKVCRFPKRQHLLVLRVSLAFSAYRQGQH